MRISGIYIITSPSGNRYVGQSINILSRFSKYRTKLAPEQHSLRRSFLKYGVLKHDFRILYECSADDLDFWETYYINLFDSIKQGLNLRGGGHHKFSTHDDTKMKLRAANVGKKLSEEHKNKISASNIISKAKTPKIHGIDSGSVRIVVHKEYGIFMSMAEAARISRIGSARFSQMIGGKAYNKTNFTSADKVVEEIKFTKRVYYKGGTSHMLGKKHSLEARKKMSDKNMGHVPWNKGLPNYFSDEVKNRMRDNSSISVVQLTLEGDFIKEWGSVISVIKTVPKAGSLPHCLSGKYKTSAGFKWVYKKDYNPIVSMEVIN